MRRFPRKPNGPWAGFTLLEVMIGLVLLVMILLAAYRLFFHEVRTIRSAFEHLGVNENARLFLTQFGNDVRNANWLDFPPATVREGVPMLLPALEGKVCAFTRQEFDFSVKPPDPQFLRVAQVEWHLKKSPDGTFDLFRQIESESPAFPGGPAPFKGVRKVCGGVKEILVFSSIRRPAKFSSFPGLPLKNFLVFDPYEIDGHGPALVHVRAIFVKTGRKPGESEVPFQLRTSFALRGRLNGVNP
jgi:prepilin-type N-terminal cleavage/methylation domain-containing protein